jgi:hypothetical protein
MLRDEYVSTACHAGRKQVLAGDHLRGQFPVSVVVEHEYYARCRIHPELRNLTAFGFRLPLFPQAAQFRVTASIRRSHGASPCRRSEAQLP